MSDAYRRYAVDFHIHTSYSFDSLTPPKLVIEMARRRGLDAIAITDHDTVRGALATIEANKYSDLLVIPGIEVKSNLGDIIGLYVTEEIVSREFGAVIDEIHAQGGIAYVPHPIRTFKAKGMPDILQTYAGIDRWERYNGRYEAREFVEADETFDALSIEAALCGSDAHAPWEVGIFRTLLPGLPRDAQSLLDLSRHAELIAKPRAELPLRSGITLGTVTKALKRRQYAKFGRLLATLPYKALRRALKVRRGTSEPFSLRSGSGAGQRDDRQIF